MRKKLRLTKINYLVIFFLILISLSTVYWFVVKHQEAVSQELTEEYMELTTRDSETILDRAKFITNRDGQVDIAVLGSSVTRGKGATNKQPVWGERLEQRLNRDEEIKAKVWNKGYNGYSTTDLLTQKSNRND